MLRSPSHFCYTDRSSEKDDDDFTGFSRGQPRWKRGDANGIASRPGSGLVVLGVLALVAGLILAAALVSVSFPQARAAIFEEDRLVEWLTVLAFAVAFVLGFRRVRRVGGRDLLLLAVTGFAAIAALDELSFGERTFGWDAPRVYGTKLDALHDLIQIGKKAIKWQTESPYLVSSVIGLVLCGVGALVLLYLLRRGWQIWLGIDAALVAAAIGCLVVAQGIDVDLKTFYSPVLKPL